MPVAQLRVLEEREEQVLQVMRMAALVVLEVPPETVAAEAAVGPLALTA